MTPKGSPRNKRPPDYYALLGVALEAKYREIEAAYWAQASSPENRDQLALINEAYEVLGQTARRAAYDATYVPAQAEPEPEPAEPGYWGNRGLASKLRWHLK